MDRRNALSLLAGMTGTALAPGRLWAQAAPPRVVVIGAGIMGASIAYHLARAGARVEVLERVSPGSQATQGAFAMLIATHEGDRAFNDLYGMAVLDWRRLQDELGAAVRIQWGGTCSWAPPGPAAASLGALTRQLQGWGAPIRPISAANLAELVPGVVAGPFGAGNFSPEQGTLDPSEALQALVGAARRLGVRFRYPCEVTSLTRDGGGRITAAQTTDGPVEADVFVLAVGQGLVSTGLAAQVGVKAPDRRRLRGAGA